MAIDGGKIGFIFFISKNNNSNSNSGNKLTRIKIDL